MISCDFLACRGGSAKYQTCLIFQQPSTTLVPDSVSVHLEIGLSWSLPVLCYHGTGLSLSLKSHTVQWQSISSMMPGKIMTITYDKNKKKTV